MLGAVAAWAHHLTDNQRNGGDWLYGGAVLVLAACVVCSIAAWTHAAVVTARRLDLTRATVHLETVIAAAVSLAMATITGATAIWWASVAGAAPAFLGAVLPWNMLALALTMLAATSLAIAGTLRAMHNLV